ncbi:MAG: hypothetical protein Q9175_002576 [Cornicularia normoerica]
MSTKLSICLIYYHLFQRANSPLIRATRMVTYGLALLVIGYYLPAFFVSIFQCTPVSKSWLSKESGTCVNLDRFRFCTAAANIITSVLVIATPLPALSKMRHTRPEVSELMGLILLGIVLHDCQASPHVEKDVGIIAASLIVMRPCLEAIRNAVLKRSYFRTISSARNNAHEISSQVSRPPRDNGILRTDDFELESQHMSTREVTPKDLL